MSHISSILHYTIYHHSGTVLSRNETQHTTQEETNMMETVKVVNGYAIERMKGTRGFYEVTLVRKEKMRKYMTFKTIKSATEYIEMFLTDNNA